MNMPSWLLPPLASNPGSEMPASVPTKLLSIRLFEAVAPLMSMPSSRFAVNALLKPAPTLLIPTMFWGDLIWIPDPHESTTHPCTV